MEAFRMTKYIVVGVYQFLGFHLCNSLLEKGYEVCGVNWETKQTADVDEKAMLFDRNANFSFYPSFDSKMIEGETLLCFDGYHYSQSSQIEKALSEVGVLEGASEIEQLRVLLFISSRMEMDSEQWMKRIQGYSNVQCIYVDDLYGPWLTEKDQNAIEEEEQSIYVEDLCQEWMKIITLDAPFIHIMSEDLREESKIVEGNDENDESKIVVKIPIYTSRQVGLQAMKDHRQKLKLLHDWND